MFTRKLALTLGLASILVCRGLAEDLPASGTAGYDFVCTTALDPATGAMVSHFTVVNTTVAPPVFLGRLKLQALVATSLNRRFQAAPLETEIAHDPTSAYNPPTIFGVFFVPTDQFSGSAGSITVIDNRTTALVRTTLPLPEPCVYDVLVDPAHLRAYCAYIGPSGALEVQAVDYSTATPFLLGAPVVLPGPPSPYVTRMSINPSGNRLYTPYLTGVAVLAVGGTPALFNTVPLPANSAFVATNVDSDFPLNGDLSPPWNICATDAVGTATTGANVLVFNVSGGTVYSLPAATGFGIVNGAQYVLASGHNDLATISGWLDQANPSYVLLRDSTALALPGAVGVISNTLVGGALSMALAPTTGEPFGNPNMALAPNRIAFNSFDNAFDYIAVLARALPPGAVTSTALLGYVNPSEQDMPVICQGGSAASTHTEFIRLAAGFETENILTVPPTFVGNVATAAPAISLPGAWRGPLVFPLTAVATNNVTALVQCPLGAYAYTPFVFPGTGGRANFPQSLFPFVPMPPAPPYGPITIMGILGPKRPAFNQSANTGVITSTNVAFDAGVGGVPGSAMAIVAYGGPMTIVPIPLLVIGQTNYQTIVLSSEILTL